VTVVADAPRQSSCTCMSALCIKQIASRLAHLYSAAPLALPGASVVTSDHRAFVAVASDERYVCDLDPAEVEQLELFERSGKRLCKDGMTNF
jgi:hypothetical protein